MPRPKRAVGFWRGAPNAGSKPSLLPPADQYTNTPVDPWPRAYREELRHELLAIKRRKPGVSAADLLVAARNWAARRERPSGVPKKITQTHVDVLLHARRKSRRDVPTSTAAPLKRDRSQRRTMLSGEEIAEAIRKSLAASQSGKPAQKPLSDRKRSTRKGSKKKRSAERSPSSDEKVRTARTARHTANVARSPSPPRMPGGAPPATATLSARAGVRNDIEVGWLPVPSAIRARVDLLAPDGSRLRRETTAAEAGTLRIGKVAGLPRPVRVYVLFSGEGGKILAQGETELDLA